MRTLEYICNDLESVAFRYERLTALIDIMQENAAESPSYDSYDVRIGAALYEILNGMEDSNNKINNLLEELRSISKVQEIKHGKD